MNKTFHFYDPATGLFSGRSYSGPEDGLIDNTPVGLSSIEGDVDHASQRVNLATGEIEDYQPPSPGADFAWEAQSKRWALTDRAARAAHKRAKAKASIEALEKSQGRALRELALGKPGASDRLAEIDAAITILRPDIIE